MKERETIEREFDNARNRKISFGALKTLRRSLTVSHVTFVC